MQAYRDILAEVGYHLAETVRLSILHVDGRTFI